MSLIHHMAAAIGASGGTRLTLSGGSPSEANNAGSDATQELKVDQDGNVYYRDNGGSWVQLSSSTDHTRPTGDSPGTLEVSYTGASGDTGSLSGQTEDVWTALSSGDWIIMITDSTPTLGGKSATFTLQLRWGSSGDADETGGYTLSADREDF